MTEPSPRRYVCRSCRRVHARYTPRCLGCASYEMSLLEEAIDTAPVPSVPVQVPARERELRVVPAAPAAIVPPTRPIPLSQVVEQKVHRTLTRIDALDHVLGGGLVTGSIVVLGGTPGAGKSTITAQMLEGLGLCCLYATGEESVAQVAERAQRIDVQGHDIHVVAETRLEVVIEHAHTIDAKVVLVDSIQTIMCEDVKGAAGSPAQVRECAFRLAQFAKSERGPTVVLIGHVTHDDGLAGPRTLAHLVDVVLMLEVGTGDERIVRATKNRFGPTGRIGRFELTASGLIPLPEEEDVDDGDGGGNSIQ